MSWQKVARAIVALVGIGAAVGVYLMLRTPPAVDPVAQVGFLPGEVTAVSDSPNMKVVDGDGAVLYELWAAARRTLADGREQYDNIRVQFPHAGTTHTITANRAERSGVAGPTGERPSQVIFNGNVQMTDGAGFAVQTEDATYLEDEERITFPGPLTFTRGTLSGNGVGGDLYMEKSVIWLYDQAEMTITPEDGGVGVTATGTRIGLAESDHYLRVEENARLVREDQELTSDVMVVYFAEDTRAARRIELDGHAGVVRSAQGSADGNRPDMHADAIALDFVPETSALSRARLNDNAVLTLRESVGQTRVSGRVIELAMAPDGTTLTRLTSTGGADVQLPRDGTTPARVITAPDLLAEGPEATGLDRAIFSGGVTYTEGERDARGRLTPVRTASSSTLALSLAGSLRDVSDATFRQNFKVSEEGLTAEADQGVYDAAGGRMELRALVPARVRPRVVTEEIEVSGDEIDLDLEADGIDARGNVQSLRKVASGAAPSDDSSGLFESGKPVAGKAGRLTYSKASGVAVYTGTVTLFQDATDGTQGNVLRADSVRLDEKEGDVSAEGHVRSTFMLTSADDTDGNATLEQTSLVSDAMRYTSATRTSVYEGHVSMDSANGEKLSGQTITLFLLPDRRALKGLEAIAAPGDLVRGTLRGQGTEDRRVSGLKLTYDVKDDRYVVTGTPATMISRAPAKGPDMCEVTMGSVLTYLRSAASANVRGEGGAVATAQDRKCSEVIK